MATAVAASTDTPRIATILRRHVPLVVLLLYAGLLFLPGLGDRDLNSSHEARAAQNAQGALSYGHWLLPRLFDGHVELQKPPLFYWLVAAVGYLNGGRVEPWCVRLPAALAALGCVVVLYLAGRRLGRPATGFIAALVLASCLHFTWLARVGRIDMPLTFVVTGTLGCFALGQGRNGGRGWPWFLAGYTALGVGVLLKGPIALVLPALVVVAVRCANDGPLSLMCWRHSTLWWGGPCVAAIAGPWFIWANIETDNRLWQVFFWYHNIERGLGGSATLAAHPAWFYVPQAGIDLLPWSLLAPAAAWHWWRSPSLRNDRFARAGLAWFGVVFAFLSCMSFKRADYLLPAYPGFALFLGAAIEHWVKRRAFHPGEPGASATGGLGKANPPVANAPGSPG
jgi:4-amino-4-deoxy-L-arabinose transferase-like glycosyltransferase